MQPLQRPAEGFSLVEAIITFYGEAQGVQHLCYAAAHAPWVHTQFHREEDGVLGIKHSMMKPMSHYRRGSSEELEPQLEAPPVVEISLSDANLQDVMQAG